MSKQTIKSYDEILKSIEENPVQKMDSGKLCSVLCNISKEHREHLYMFIIHHYQLTGSTTWKNNPYKGKTFDGGKGVKFNWMNLPPKLQDIFTRYIEQICIEN